MTNSPITRIEELNGKKWIQAGNRAIETEAIIFTDNRKPNIAGLNLAGVNVKDDCAKISVNDKLQTTNPQIYACGDLLGGYSLANVDRYEVNIALKNALFLPCFKTNYRELYWSVDIRPNLARVGITERQARRFYGDNFVSIKKHYRNSFSLPKLGVNTEFCQLLIHNNGTILGCALVGENATKAIESIALVMKYKIKLDRNSVKGLLNNDFPDSIQRLIREVNTNKLRKEPLVSRLESWFELGRNWSK